MVSWLGCWPSDGLFPSFDGRPVSSPIAPGRQVVSFRWLRPLWSREVGVGRRATVSVAEPPLVALGAGRRFCRAIWSSDGRTAAPGDGDWFDPYWTAVG